MPLTKRQKSFFEVWAALLILAWLLVAFPWDWQRNIVLVTVFCWIIYRHFKRRTRESSGDQGDAGDTPKEGKDPKSRLWRIVIIVLAMLFTAVVLVFARAGGHDLFRFLRGGYEKFSAPYTSRGDEDFTTPYTGRYETYTDPEKTFCVDLPENLDVKRSTVQVPTVTGQNVSIRAIAAGVNSDIEFSVGVWPGISQYVTEKSPMEIVTNRLKDGLAGAGVDEPLLWTVMRPGCTTVRGIGRGIAHGRTIHVISEMCLIGDRLFILTCVSYVIGFEIEKLPSVERFFNSFRGL